VEADDENEEEEEKKREEEQAKHPVKKRHKKDDSVEVVTNLFAKVAGGSQSDGEIDAELREFSSEALLSAQANLTLILGKITAKLQENLSKKARQNWLLKTTVS